MINDSKTNHSVLLFSTEQDPDHSGVRSVAGSTQLQARLPVMKLFARAMRVAAMALVCAVVAGWSGAASAAPKASLVMDLRNGKVLYARSADRKLHPASLTKMMTLYLTFEAVRKGKLRLNQKIRVSRKASRQPASKLYLRAGQRVTVRSLIRATALKSANDAAMVLAEAIGGSEKRFGQLMTNKAKRLGMRNTAFRNPHGLTRVGHYSTARDMAILGRHLFFDFPEYYNIFKRRTDYAAGKRIWSTNRLLSTYDGADGIKTGYTRAAGYNLVASATRGKKKIIAVAFGERSSGARARKVARLLDIGFSSARKSVRRVRPQKREPATVRASSRSRKGRIVVKRSPMPRRKPGMRETVLAAVAQVVASPAAAATPSQTMTPNGKAPGRSKASLAPLVAELPKPRGSRIKPKADAPVQHARKSAAPRNALVRVPIPRPKPMRLAINARR